MPSMQLHLSYQHVRKLMHIYGLPAMMHWYFLFFCHIYVNKHVVFSIRIFLYRIFVIILLFYQFSILFHVV